MDSKIITLQKIDGIYDIQPIITPSFSAFELAVLCVLLVSFLSISIYLVWILFYSTKAKSRREIIKLRKKVKLNIINTNDAVYELCLILRKGIEQKQLNTRTPTPKNSKGSKQRWGKFINELTDFRYSENSGSSIDISKLFDESLFWLQR